MKGTPNHEAINASDTTSTENQRNLRTAHPFEPNQSRGEVQDLCCGDVVGVKRALQRFFYNLKPCDRTEFWFGRPGPRPRARAMDFESLLASLINNFFPGSFFVP